MNKTNGGYEIFNFRLIKNPKARYPLLPMIFEGEIKNSSGEIQTIEWDTDGKCSNHVRQDYFISPEIFRFAN